MICRPRLRLTLYSAVLLLLCLSAGKGFQAVLTLAQTPILQELQTYVNARAVSAPATQMSGD